MKMILRYATLSPLLALVCASAEQQQLQQQLQQQQHVRRAQEYGDIIEHGFTNRLTGGQGIVGGTEANAGEFPWFVAFDPLVQCGGSLIAPNRVLTAAHCVTGGAPQNVLVGPSTGSDGEQIAVTCASYHPNYYIGPGGDLFNDMAILKLAGSSDATPITLNSNVNYPLTEGTPMTVIGYGAVSEGGRVSSVLKKLGTFFQATDTCQDNYPNVEFGTHVCGNVDGAGDCQGDSGGPLFDADGVQIGVVSYGFGCARSQEDVYGGVAKHYDWIQEQINNDDCNVQPEAGLLNAIINCLTNVSSLFIWVQSLFSG